MTAFVVFAPAVLDPADCRIEVSVSGHEGIVHLVGMYPIHESERLYIGERGLEAFWDLDWDPYDMTWPPPCKRRGLENVCFGHTIFACSVWCCPAGCAKSGQRPSGPATGVGRLTGRRPRSVA